MVNLPEISVKPPQYIFEACFKYLIFNVFMLLKCILYLFLHIINVQFNISLWTLNIEVRHDDD